MQDPKTAEHRRLLQHDKRQADWRRWGPYVSERAWGTVREDYSENGDAWRYLPHDHARSRAYRWSEDGLAAICDRFQHLCMGLALWNERDPILKERLFGLSGPEGNHGEDVKELYYYLDSDTDALVSSRCSTSIRKTLRFPTPELGRGKRTTRAWCAGSRAMSFIDVPERFD